MHALNSSPSPRPRPSSPCATLVLLALALCAPARAQLFGGARTLPTASRLGDLQLGGGVVLGSSRYNFATHTLLGGAFYATLDLRQHLGAEFDLRQEQHLNDSGAWERTFEIGPRVYLTRGSFKPYAKLLYGRGIYNFPYNEANLAYNVFTFGGGADFVILPSLNLRADYELQSWPGFPLGTLHPSILTIGAAFHFHQ